MPRLGPAPVALVLPALPSPQATRFLQRTWSLCEELWEPGSGCSLHLLCLLLGPYLALDKSPAASAGCTQSPGRGSKLDRLDCSAARNGGLLEPSGAGLGRAQGLSCTRAPSPRPGLRAQGRPRPGVITCVSERLRLPASCFRSAPTT